MKRCRKCVDCRTLTHHWVEECRGNHDYECKHCSAIGELCPHCVGDGCDACRGEGVVRVQSRRGLA
jgi:hypothetical protein